MKIITVISLLALVPFAALAQEKTDVPAGNTRTKITPKKTSTPQGWTDNFEAAKKQAAAEGKDILVAFSGSDWCGWCVRLEKEVFSEGNFAEKVSKFFVPVYIDNPNDLSLLSEHARKQNRALTDHYRIEGFPTVLLMDASGCIFAQTGYAAGGPEKYLEMLKKLRDDGKNSPEYKTQKALNAVPNGPDRVRKLDELLVPLPLPLQIANENYVDEILAADADGSLGLRAKYPYFTIVRPLKQELQAEVVRLSQLTDEALKAQGSPSDKATCMKIATEVLRKNADTLRKLRQRADKAQSMFAGNTHAARRVGAIQQQLHYLFSNYIDKE
ncbi:MAG: thioredoxin family protein [Opitutales bacterium]|nr:thioredoxin family protein [Opitutales bacterium]